MPTVKPEFGLKLVATNDVHYLEKNHSHAHDCLICIGTQTTLNDTKRLHYQMEQFYLQQLHNDLTVESIMLAEPALDALVGNDLQPLRDMLAAVDRESAVRVRVFDASGNALTPAVANAKTGPWTERSGL